MAKFKLVSLKMTVANQSSIHDEVKGKLNFWKCCCRSAETLFGFPSPI